MGALVIRKLLLWMPLLFGIGFIAPLTAQTLVYWDIAPPLGLSPLVAGLVFGGVYQRFGGPVALWGSAAGMVAGVAAWLAVTRGRAYTSP